jgi:hypothetical protein
MEQGKRGYGSIMFNPYLVGGLEHFSFVHNIFQWIGLRKNLQETPIFNGKNHGFLQIFPQSNDWNIGNNPSQLTWHIDLAYRHPPRTVDPPCGGIVRSLQEKVESSVWHGGHCRSLALCNADLEVICMTGWWFGTFFIFNNIWDNPSH